MTDKRYDDMRAQLDGALRDLDAAISRAESAEARVTQLEGALAMGQLNCDELYDGLREERDTALATLARVEALLTNFRDLDYDGPDEWSPSRRDTCNAIEAALKGAP